MRNERFKIITNKPIVTGSGNYFCKKTRFGWQAKNELITTIKKYF